MYSEELNNLIKNNLYNTNFGRILLLNRFENIITSLTLSKKLELAVIGGSKRTRNFTFEQLGLLNKYNHFWNRR